MSFLDDAASSSSSSAAPMMMMMMRSKTQKRREGKKTKSSRRRRRSHLAAVVVVVVSSSSSFSSSWRVSRDPFDGTARNTRCDDDDALHESRANFPFFFFFLQKFPLKTLCCLGFLLGVWRKGAPLSTIARCRSKTTVATLLEHTHTTIICRSSPLLST